VAIAKANISELRWCPVPGGAQLRVRQTAGATVCFNGFPKAAADELEPYVREHFGLELQKDAFALTGHNWGKLSVHGSSVAFTVRGEQRGEGVPVLCRSVARSLFSAFDGCL